MGPRPFLVRSNSREAVLNTEVGHTAIPKHLKQVFRAATPHLSFSVPPTWYGTNMRNQTTARATGSTPIENEFDRAQRLLNEAGISTTEVFAGQNRSCPICYEDSFSVAA